MKKKISILSFLLLCFWQKIVAQTIMNIHRNNGAVTQIAVSEIDSITYTINNPGSPAILTTHPISNITLNSAVSGGNITSDGGTFITYRGVVWDTLPNPNGDVFATSEGQGTGSYSSSINGLIPGKTYYVRAYAINSAGFSYGNQIVFNTLAEGVINSLDCTGYSINGSLISYTPTSNVTLTIPYSGGNGGHLFDQLITSTGVTGLDATLLTDSLSLGAGMLSYSISGTPNSLGIATFSINIGGQNCILNIPVNSHVVSNNGPGVSFDGYTYSTVVLGNGQEWLAENLRSTIYSNGDTIEHLTNQNDVNTNISQNIGGWVHFNFDNQYENIYGKLYNSYTIQDTRNVCPSNWHVATDADWDLLVSYLDPYSSTSHLHPQPQSIIAGQLMKSETNWDGTNESGLSGLPGGNFSGNVYFLNLGSLCVWWSNTYEPGNNSVKQRYIEMETGNIYQDYVPLGDGFRYIRCVKN